jgi:transcriptional regulator with XRE-family HTH domain
MKDAVRLYLRELRDLQGITQQDAADNIGWSLRAYSDWETGKTNDIKFRFIVRLVVLVGASWEDISQLELDNFAPDDGARLAEKRIKSPSEKSNQELQSLINELMTDEALMNAFIIFWSGWKARKAV